MKLFAGLDVGTTSIKCVLFDETGDAVGRASRATGWASRRGGRELAATDLVHAARAVLTEATDQVDGRVDGIGVTGMAESGVALDRHGDAVTPVVAWNDARAESTVDAVYDRLGREEFVDRSGLPTSGRNTLAKLHWERVAGTGLETAVTWLGVPELIAHNFGAERVAERSLASRTGMYDVIADHWVPAFLTAGDLDHLTLPELCDAGAVIGTATGLADRVDGAVIVVGGHDHLCASIGVDAVGPADVVDSMGTGEAIGRVVPPDDVGREWVRKVTAAGMTVSRHPLAGRLAVMAGLGSGLILKRALLLAGLDPSDPDLAERLEPLDRAALRATEFPTITEDPATGFWTIDTVGPDTTAAALWRAALVFVGQRAARAVTAMDDLVGRRQRIVACGGWLRSAAVRETKLAAIGGFEWSHVAEPGALGSAVLAARAAGADITILPTVALDPARPG